MISGIFTALALLGFLGIASWAYARHNRARFDEAAQLPLGDEDVAFPQASLKANKAGGACCSGDHK